MVWIFLPFLLFNQNYVIKTQLPYRAKKTTLVFAGSDGKSQSTTKSAVAEGTIQITQNKDQDITDLGRDTANANNPLTPIFDKNKILENQEAAKIFGEIGFTIVGDIISKNNWAKDDPRSIALHALVGGIMAEINGGTFGEGLSVAAINKLIISQLSELRDEKGKVIIPNDMLLWISAALGEAIGGSQGATIADSATKNNQLTKRQIEILNQAKDNGDKEVIEFLENLNLAQSYISGYLVGGDFDLDDPEKAKLAEAVMINAIQLGKVPTREDLAYVEGSLILAVVGGYGVYSHGGKVFKAAMNFSPVLTSGTAIEKISGNINFSQTASVHMSNINRFVPVQTLKDVINFSRSFPDPQGSTAKMFYSQMYKNGSLYNLEVLYDKTTNTIFHFKYTREALGPLQEIIK